MPILLTFIISIALQSAALYGFKSEANQLTWQHVYTNPQASANIVTLFKAHPNIKDVVQLDSNSYVGNLTLLSAQYKPLGFSEMSVPMYVARNHVNARVRLDVKQDSYRTTINGIMLQQIYTDPLSGQGELHSLETYALNKKGEFTSGFKQKPATIYEYTFMQAFSFMEDASEDW